MTNLSGKARPLAALAMVALISAGCSTGSAGNGDAGTRSTPGAGGGASTNATAHDKAMRFARCMRDNGVREFPDPDAAGALTIDGVINGSSLDPSSATWRDAVGACKGLEPAGFVGHTRSAQQQAIALRFAQCMRDNGVEDFPDPTRGGPLIDTNRIPSLAGKDPRTVPGFKAAQERCGADFGDALGIHQ